MSILPSIRVVSGSGKPRVVHVQASAFYTSTGTPTYTATTVVEAEGTTTAITSSSVANPTVITTGTAHGKVAGDFINIVGHTGSTPDINGKWYVLATPSTTQLTIGVNVGVGGTGGTLRKTPAFGLRGMSVNRRVFVESTSGTPTYAKIISINDTTNTLTVDFWANGTPSSGAFKIDGWISDLPYCGELTETFMPDALIQPLYRHRKSVKHYGYLYECRLDYSKYISGDTLTALASAMNPMGSDRLILMPRVDAPRFQYNVHLSGNIDMSMVGAGLGHRKVALVFAGTEVVQFPTATGYGTNYANAYGTGL